MSTAARAAAPDGNSSNGMGNLTLADERIGESLAKYCAKYPAYVTTGRFDNQPAGLSWRYALDTNAGGEWLKAGLFDQKSKTLSGAGFAIRHFGNTVFYHLQSFTEKNTDYVDDDLATSARRQRARGG